LPTMAGSAIEEGPGMSTARARTTAHKAASFGDLLRDWRQRRRLSQLALASEAEISTRHLSFMETGRAMPSRTMVLRLAEQLEVPLRERNELLVAAGHAPEFVERRLDDPALGPARRAVDLVLKAHEPFPAIALDRHWTIIATNEAVAPLLEGVAPHLLAGAINVMRLSLHPEGLAPRILNLAEVRAHLLDRLRRQIDMSADPVLIDLMAEVKSWPAPIHIATAALAHDPYGGLVVPVKLASPAGPLTLFSTTTVFGSPLDITLAELAIETFFPGDEATARAFRGQRP